MDNRKLDKKPEPATDEKGRPLITAKYVTAVCEFNGGYSTPELNEILYLNCLGFPRIENLEPFHGCKVLFLDGNALDRIQGLAHFCNLKTLLLQNNLIKKMEGLNSLGNLDSLNLANNMIKKIEGISSLKKLKKLDLSANHLTSYESLAELAENPELRILFLKDNAIDYDERILDLFAQHHEIKYLELRGNDFMRKCPNYRRTLITKLKSLCFLEERPVDFKERHLANAFVQGGKALEDMERDHLRYEGSEASKRHMDKVRQQREEALRRWEEKQKQTGAHQLEQLQAQIQELEYELKHIAKTEKRIRDELEEAGRKRQAADEETLESLLMRCEKVMTDPNASPEMIEHIGLQLQREASRGGDRDKELAALKERSQQVGKQLQSLQVQFAVLSTTLANQAETPGEAE
jgi:chromosome segregation ATPase